MKTDSIHARVFAEQVGLLYSKPAERTLLHLIPGVMIYWLVADYTGHMIAASWLSILTLVNIGRYLEIKVTQRKLGSVTDFTRLRNRFAAGSGITGLTYGLGLVLFLPSLPPILQITILSVAITVVPGAMVSFTTDKLSFFQYLLPKIGLPVIQCLLWGDKFHLYLALYGMVYLMVLAKLFYWYYNALTEAIVTRLTHADLVASLTNSNRQLETLSLADALTGVSNRRFFDVTLHKEMFRAQRSRTPISLIMLDIDYFKAYNDCYGHPAGDECLKAVSAAMQEVAKRSGDTVARYGGEEFCIIMPETDQAGARQLARQLQDAITQLKIPHNKSTIADHVTVSIGIVTAAPHYQISLKEFINIADQALYAAKSDGRNLIREIYLNTVTKKEPA